MGKKITATKKSSKIDVKVELEAGREREALTRSPSGLSGSGGRFGFMQRVKIQNVLLARETDEDSRLDPRL